MTQDRHKQDDDSPPPRQNGTSTPDEQSTRLIERDQHQQTDRIYDQNRNLHLDEIEKEKEEEQEEEQPLTRSPTLSHRQLACRRQSPTCSYDLQSGASCSSSQSTDRLATASNESISQLNTKKIPSSICCNTHRPKESQAGPPSMIQDKNQHVVTFVEANELHQDADCDAPLKQNHENNYCELLTKFQDEKANNSNQAPSLWRSIGRRLSLFSTNRNRRRNSSPPARDLKRKHSVGGHYELSSDDKSNRQHELSPDRRRHWRRRRRAFSLQNFFSAASSSASSSSCSSLQPGRPASIHSDEAGGRQPQPQPPTTVAGVGGTITTVTRSKRKTAPLPRLVAKNGTVNLFLDNIDRRKYVRDLFTTMIDIKWRYNLLAAAFGFVFSWLLFACIWYMVLLAHNDLEHENDPNWSPCIVNVHSFRAALLFSIETQSTLGFGSRIISVECPGAIMIFCVQLIFGVVVECLIVGMVFAKLSRPAKRSQTIMFSKYATVCLRENKMCLMFRVGDVRSKSHIIGTTIRVSLVSQKITREGEIIPFYHYKLAVKIDDSNNNLLLIWPVTIVHLIDQSSPFYRLSLEQLAQFKFEIITVLEGTVESTGQSIQVRSSYLPSEVKWGYRFEPIVSTHGFGRHAQTIIDYNKFNRVIEIDTPTCSPCEYYARQQQQQDEELQLQRRLSCK